MPGMDMGSTNLGASSCTAAATKPVLMHIANGMYGAIVVEPKPGVLPKADKNYVLVASEWYLDSDGLNKPAQFNMAKPHARQPDWMTFNGYAGQYVKHPLTAKPGELGTPPTRSTTCRR